jgi:hypothetical protein
LPLNKSNVSSKARLDEFRQRKQSLPPARAVRWDDKTVEVICPYCLKIHRHSFSHFTRDDKGSLIQDGCGRFSYDGPSPCRPESRKAHCNHELHVELEYCIIFPFEEDSRVEGLWFEIEITRKIIGSEVKEIEKFRTVGLEDDGLLLVHEEDEESAEERAKRLEQQRLDTLAVQFAVNLRLSDDEVIIQSATDLLWLHSSEGNLGGVRSILEVSTDRGRLIQLKDEYGYSALPLAVCNGHVGVVEFLLENGAGVNCTDAKGRTPLMEAALWGHVKIVDILLKKGAKKEIRDRNDMAAVDFTEESERNDEERHRRYSLYTEDPYVKKQHRRLIRCLLGTQIKPPASTSIALDDPTNTYFYKSAVAGSISIIIPRSGIRITTQSKTAALLDHGIPFSILLAVSGWSDPGRSPYQPGGAGCSRLDCAYWRKQISTIAKALQFEFKSHEYDERGDPGSFFASHAEIQLMVYFISKNYLFRDYPERTSVDDDFLQLFLLQKRRNQARILVAHERGACTECYRFADCVKARTKIAFNFVLVKALAEKN